MTRTLIDLSVPMEHNRGEPAHFRLEQTDHRRGGDIFGRRYAFSGKHGIASGIKALFNYIAGRNKISHKIFPDEEFLNMEIVTASTHTGTHFDAPLHFGSKSEGKRAASVDEIPLEWCFGNGVVLDLTFKSCGEFIQKEDIEKSLKKIGYKLKPFDIVLLRTDADKYWDTKDYLSSYPGMSRGAVEYLISQGIKVVGIDSYGFDRPFVNMIKDYFETQDKGCLFPAHFFGREKSYCHIERLTNLDKIPISYGFQIACFPIRLKGAGAAWTRVVAII